MSYTPLNQAIFEAAFAGALAGMGVSGRVITSASASSYTGLATVAGAFAQAVDTSWGANASNLVEEKSMALACEAEWENRAPLASATNILAATYSTVAAAIVACVQSDIVYFAAQGITPQTSSGTVALRAQVPSAAAVNPYVIATAMSIILPDGAKAHAFPDSLTGEAAWIRTGSAGIGRVTAVATANTAPATTTCMVAPNGDLLFNNATDAPTSVDVYYQPERQNIVSANYVVTPGTGVVAGLPANIISILEAEALVGGVTGKCVVQIPAAAAPATGLAGLNLAKTGVFFCIADAVTSCRLKLGVA